MQIEIVTNEQQDFAIKLDASRVETIDSIAGDSVQISFFSGGYVILPVPMRKLLKQIIETEKG